MLRSLWNTRVFQFGTSKTGNGKHCFNLLLKLNDAMNQLLAVLTRRQKRVPKAYLFASVQVNNHNNMACSSLEAARSTQCYLIAYQ